LRIHSLGPLPAGGDRPLGGNARQGEGNASFLSAFAHRVALSFYSIHRNAAGKFGGSVSTGAYCAVNFRASSRRGSDSPGPIDWGPPYERSIRTIFSEQVGARNMSLIDKAKQAAHSALDKTKEAAGSAAQAVEHAATKAGNAMHEAGAAIAQGASSAADRAKLMADKAADATESTRAAVKHGAQTTLNKAKTAGASAVAGAGQMANKAADAVVTGAEKVTGKDLNKDGKVG
jgi:hypothetical protein